MTDIKKAFLFAIGGALGLTLATLLLKMIGAPTEASAK